MFIDMKTLTLIDCCPSLGADAMGDDEAEAAAHVFGTLADPARVKILNRLAHSDEAVCGCEFMGPLGLAQATVSYHLKKLTDAGLLEREQRGKWAYFTLNRDALANLANVVRIPEVV